MTQEEKQLLLIDLCARLPYGVKVYTNAYHKPVTLGGYYNYIADEFYFIEPEFWLETKYFKPYLRSMSSMTEEEWDEYYHYGTTGTLTLKSDACGIDWLNAHHFDHRDLIEKGLALEAPEGMYTTE